MQWCLQHRHFPRATASPWIKLCKILESIFSWSHRLSCSSRNPDDKFVLLVVAVVEYSRTILSSGDCSQCDLRSKEEKMCEHSQSEGEGKNGAEAIWHKVSWFLCVGLRVVQSPITKSDDGHRTIQTNRSDSFLLKVLELSQDVQVIADKNLRETLPVEIECKKIMEKSDQILQSVLILYPDWTSALVLLSCFCKELPTEQLWK